MHPIDTLVVALYLAGTLALGLWLTRRVRGSDDFFLAGRKLPFWAIGMSLVVSDIGALEMVGGTAGAYEHGISQANFEWIGCVPAMIVGGLLFIPLYWRTGVYSIPEFLGQRYGGGVRAVLAVVSVAFMAAALGVFFQASAAMMQSVVGLQPALSIPIIAILVAIYTVGGGLGAVVVTDVIQCIILFIGGLILAGVGYHEAGGWSGITESLSRAGDATREHLELLPGRVGSDGEPSGYPWPGILLGLGLVLSPAYWLGNQAIVQRTLGARDEWHARASMIFGAALKTIVPLAFVLPGIFAVVLLPATERDANSVYAELIRSYLPVGARGVLYAAFLAALMSSVDSYTNSAATIFTKDLYRPLIGRSMSDREDLLVGRLTSLVLIGLGVAMVPIVAEFKTIYEAFQTYLSFFQGPVLALILGGVIWRGRTRFAGLACLLAGLTTSAILHVPREPAIHFLNIAWWSFVVSAVVLVLMLQLIEKPVPEGAER
ncbi:MAG: sodium/solute symporter [Planctomycetota bacterium]